MYDVWDVIGLSGTGTDSYSVEDLFIPEKHAALRDDFTALREKGPLYGITTYTMFGLGFAAHLARRRPRHARCRRRSGARQGHAGSQGDAGE